MLKIIVPGWEDYDEKTSRFIVHNPTALTMEHSLKSISKWESKWRKSYISTKKKTQEEVLYYIQCMTLTKNVDPEVYKHLSRENSQEILDYITTEMTATTFTEQQKKAINNKIITSEQIYFWMTAYNIPWECQNWHLSRLMTLIHVCALENAPKKKMGMQERLSQQKALNAKRRAKHGRH